MKTKESKITQGNPTLYKDTESNLSRLITKEMFNEMFPHRNYYLERPELYPAYEGCKEEIVTYEALIEASEFFPDFCNIGTEENQKRELAAFFGNVSQETTVGWGPFEEGSERYTYGLGLTIEGGNIYPKSHQVESTDYPAVGSKSYQGRGALQLSYNPNYGIYSEFEYDNKDVLLKNPNIVGFDSLLFWKSAIWFWMTRELKDTPGYWNKPSCHYAITGIYKPTEYQTTHYGIKPGFGLTVIIINGGVESKTKMDQLDPNSLEANAIKDKVKSRIGFYKRYCNMLDVYPGDEDTLNPLTMEQFPQKKNN